MKMSILGLRKYLLFFLLILPFAWKAAGQAVLPAGNLNPAFEENGIVWMEIPNITATEMNAIVLDEPRNRLLTTGTLTRDNTRQFGITRFSLNGSYTGFVTKENGEEGLVNGMEIAVDLRGRIVAGGSVGNPLGDQKGILLRFTEGGILDAAFGNDGVVRPDFGNRILFREFSAIALTEENKIIAGGRAEINNAEVIAFIRINEDGSIDRTLGDNGLAVLNLRASPRHYFSSLLLDPNGKILVSGAAEINQSVVGIVARFGADGTPDTNQDDDIGVMFGQLGIQTVQIPGARETIPTSLALDPANNIIVGGLSQTLNPAGVNGFVARLLPNGGYDPQFGDNGKRNILPGNFIETSHINVVRLDSDGKIIAGGNGIYDNNPRMLIFRFLPDGSSDPDFGNGGLVATDLQRSWEELTDLILDSQNNITITGFVVDQGNPIRQSFLLQFLGHPVPDPNAVIPPAGGAGQGAGGAGQDAGGAGQGAGGGAQPAGGGGGGCSLLPR